MILLISFTVIVIVFSCALVWKSIKACRYRNGSNEAEIERPSDEEGGAAPSAPLLTGSPERPRSPPPSYEDVVEEDRKKTEAPSLK